MKPLMREMLAAGTLRGPAAELMKPYPEEQLYDTQTDPHEIRNLAQSKRPEDQRALIAMREDLNTWMAETGDRGPIPEPDEPDAPFKQEMHDWFGTPAWAEAPAE